MTTQTIKITCSATGHTTTVRATNGRINLRQFAALKRRMPNVNNHSCYTWCANQTISVHDAHGNGVIEFG